MTQTIRQIGRHVPVSRLDPASTALLLIDFQNEYFSGRLPIPDGQAALENAARLMAHADALGMPVFHIVHIGKAGGPLFAGGSGMAAIRDGLTPAPHHTVLRKTSTSSFAGTELHARLQATGARTLIVAGLMTHMCVSTAARDARQFGAASYQVVVAADACATRDLAAWDGGVIGRHALQRAALSELADNFADVMDSAAVLALPVQEETCRS